MKSTDQPNLFQHSDAAKIAAHRQAAETVRYDPHFTPEQGEERAAYYLAEAARIEALASVDPPERMVA